MESPSEISGDLRIYICLVDPLRFVVSRILLPYLVNVIGSARRVEWEVKREAYLLLKPVALIKGIVQLRIGIAKFFPAHEPFEALAKPRPGPMVLGQGRHDLRMADCACAQ